MRRLCLVAILALSACEPGVKSGGHFVILGDSISVQAGAEFVAEGVGRDWGYDFANNSIIGMGACPNQQWLATGADYSGIDDYLVRRIVALEAESHRDTWVIELGTNDSECAAAYAAEGIAPIMDAIPDDADVFWLTVSSRAAGASEMNAALEAFPGLAVFDYAGHFDGHDSWFVGPGDVHHSKAGQKEFADWLFKQLDAVFPDP